MATVESTAPIIPREILEARIEDARGRLFRAQAVIDCAAVALDRDVPQGKPAVHFALREASEVLGNVCGALELILEQAASAEELEDAGLEAEPAPAILMPSSAEVQ